MPRSQGFTYHLTFVDCFTSWPEAGDGCRNICEWVDHTFWHTLHHRHWLQIRTIFYHPIANGLVERFHHQLKASLKSQPDTTCWTEALPLVLLNIWTCVLWGIVNVGLLLDLAGIHARSARKYIHTVCYCYFITSLLPSYRVESKKLSLAMFNTPH